VVAGEVRNLAMRAAGAARDTAAQIEDVGKKISAVSEMAIKSVDEFAMVDDNVTKTNLHVVKIAAASKEQAHGIEQVNMAVAEMDKVTQQNAANAEESAGASEELNAQAEQMKSMVQELVALVGGSSGEVQAVIHDGAKWQKYRPSARDHARRRAPDASHAETRAVAKRER
jgi:methyl-accepting chemotaxis protein